MTAFLDTNILLYSISAAPDELRKRDRARALIDAGDCALSVQVLQEFYVQATRATRPDALSHEDAEGLVAAWRRFPVQESTLALLDLGLSIRKEHRFSFWDSMIIAAARALGCQALYSEDMDEGRIIGGMPIVNPFRA